MDVSLMKLECLRIAAGQGFGDLALKQAQAMFVWVTGSEPKAAPSKVKPATTKRRK